MKLHFFSEVLKGSLKWSLPNFIIFPKRFCHIESKNSTLQSHKNAIFGFYMKKLQNLLGKTIKSRKDHLKEPFLSSEKKWNIENMKAKIGLIWQCVLSKMCWKILPNIMKTFFWLRLGFFVWNLVTLKVFDK